MATKNDINRLFAEVLEYVKTSTTQNVLSAIQNNSQQSNLLSAVEKAVNTSVTTAYNNTAARVQRSLNELEQAVAEQTTAKVTMQLKTQASAQKKTSSRGGRRSSANKT
jgi:hypothetical protein